MYIYTLTPIIYSVLYNNGNANLLQYTYEWEPEKTTTKPYPAVGLSGQKIDEEQYQQQEFLFVGTDTSFGVIN